jgi:hypothetical protein
MRPRSIALSFAFVASLTWAQSSSAGVLFFDNFDLTQQLLNQYNFTKWTVTAGSVDVIGTGGQYDFYPGNGNYVDLNGSTGQNGQISSKIIFGPGTYTLSFLLGGSKGGDQGVDLPNSKTTIITLGNFSISITLEPDAGLNFYTYTFFTTGGHLVFTSFEGGNPNVGNILDDVKVASAVPEPATWFMMLIGFAGVSLVACQRNRKYSATLSVT